MRRARSGFLWPWRNLRRSLETRFIRREEGMLAKIFGDYATTVLLIAPLRSSNEISPNEMVVP
jgi:hypothetical protein